MDSPTKGWGVTAGGAWLGNSDQYQIDDCDLYAENFKPRLSAAERLAYHDPRTHDEAIASYVERLKGVFLSFSIAAGFPCHRIACPPNRQEAAIMQRRVTDAD